MPKYQVELTDGRKFEVESDSAPSEADVMAYLGGADKQPSKPAGETPYDLMRERGGFAPAQSSIARSASNAALANTARYGSMLAGSEGGATGAAITGGGEKIAQLIEGNDDPRAVAQAMGMGALPLGALAEAGGLARDVGIPAATTATNYLLNKVADVIYGKNGTDAERQAAIVASLTAASPIVGKAVGRFLGNKTPAAIPEHLQGTFETARKANDMGLVSVPSTLRDKANPMIKTMAGTIGVGQEAAERNAPAIQAAIRESTGIGSGSASFKDGEIKDFIESQYAPYEKIRQMRAQANDQLAILEQQALGKNNGLSASDAARRAEVEASPEFQRMAEPLRIQAKADVDALRSARAEVASLFKRIKDSAGKDVEASNALSGAIQKRDALEKAIDDAAKLSDDPKLLGALTKARENIAAAHTVQDVLNPGSGLVDASQLGAMLDAGVPLQGKMRDIAKFANIGRRETTELSRVGDPEAQALTGLVGSTTAIASGRPSGLLAMGIPVVRNWARGKLLSPEHQRAMLYPTASIPNLAADNASTAASARVAAIVAAKRKKEENK